jgi:hypothetical protein
MDIRQKTVPFEYGGKVYTLRCNFNVLADVQEENGGDISPALSGRRGMKNALQFLAAMMNDWADEQGWEERHTWRELGRVLRPGEVPAGKIFGLVSDALTPRKTDAEGKLEETGDNPGN